MNPKSTAGMVAVAFALGALGGAQINKPIETKVIAAHGTARLERHPDGCYCFVDEQRDVMKHCREAALAGGATEEGFAASRALCEGK